MLHRKAAQLPYSKYFYFPSCIVREHPNPTIQGTKLSTSSQAAFESVKWNYYHWETHSSSQLERCQCQKSLIFSISSNLPSTSYAPWGWSHSYGNYENGISSPPHIQYAPPQGWAMYCIIKQEQPLHLLYSITLSARQYESTLHSGHINHQNDNKLM